MPTDNSIAARMPQEMVDAIASQLQADEDWHTLGSFGLVKKTWLPSSRHHLFADVSLNSINVDGFLVILLSPDCIMAPYVRRLRLTQEHGKLLNKFLPRAQPLKSIRSLILDELRWEDLIAEAEESLLSGFTGITQLELHRANFGSFTQFVKFITTFPSLECLSLIGADWYEDFGASSSHKVEKSLSLHLTKLKTSVRSPCKGEILDWLCRCQQIPPLASLDLFGITPSDIPALSNLLPMLGSTLLHLRLQFDISHSIGIVHFSCLNSLGLIVCLLEDQTQKIDLSQIVELQSLQLESSACARPRSHHFAHSFPSILSTISSHSLKELTLGLDYENFESLESHEWAAMASIFGSPPFSSAAKIKFHITPGRASDEGELEARVRGNLGNCAAASRGMVSVEVLGYIPRPRPLHITPTIFQGFGNTMAISVS